MRSTVALLALGWWSGVRPATSPMARIDTVTAPACWRSDDGEAAGEHERGQRRGEARSACPLPPGSRCDPSSPAAPIARSDESRRMNRKCTRSVAGRNGPRVASRRTAPRGRWPGMVMSKSVDSHLEAGPAPARQRRRRHQRPGRRADEGAGLGLPRRGPVAAGDGARVPPLAAGGGPVVRHRQPGRLQRDRDRRPAHRGDARRRRGGSHVPQHLPSPRRCRRRRGMRSRPPVRLPVPRLDLRPQRAARGRSRGGRRSATSTCRASSSCPPRSASASCWRCSRRAPSSTPTPGSTGWPTPSP